MYASSALAASNARSLSEHVIARCMTFTQPLACLERVDKAGESASTFTTIRSETVPSSPRRRVMMTTTAGSGRVHSHRAARGRRVHRAPPRPATPIAMREETF